jgi:outer membrane receptor protein involved in Fe transport
MSYKQNARKMNKRQNDSSCAVLSGKSNGGVFDTIVGSRSNMKKKILATCFVLSFYAGLSLFPNPAFSQNDSLSTSREIHRLLQLSLDELINIPVSSASKIGQKTSEAPSIVSIIPADLINQYQWRSLNQIAAKQAGFSIGQDRYGHVINSRGISDLLWSKRLLVLVDGVPFSSFQSTVTDEAFSLNMVRSVEIIRGPGAALYGPQAVTGVVQINTLSFSDMKGNGEIDLSAGDYGYRNMSLLTGAKSKHLNILVSFNNFMSDGNEYDSYDGLLKKDTSGNFIKKRTQDEKSSNHFWTKIEGRGKLDGFSLSYHLQDYNFQMGHGFLTVLPDIETTSRVTRNYFVAKYVTPGSSLSKLKHEYVLKYDYEVSDFNMQIIPPGLTTKVTIKKNGKDSTYTDSTYYTHGFWEQYVTPVNNAFARSQWIYFFDNKATVMAGIEHDIVYYTGDKSHYSNIDLNRPGYRPFKNGIFHEINPLYELIKNHFVNTTGIYAQLTTGNLLGKKFTVTVGSRYDMYYYKFNSIKTHSDSSSRSLGHFSPRVALVYKTNEYLSFKAIYGNAFRLASPFEQFLSNSLISGITTKGIEPEDITNIELSSDLQVSRKVIWRNTVFHSVFKDQIRAGSKGYFTNLLRSEQQGGESELSVYFMNLSAFANYSVVKRIREVSSDTMIKTSNTLVWYPSHSVNMGVCYAFKKAELAVQGHFQSAVERKISERGSPKTGVNIGVDYDELRGSYVKPWFTMDANVRYHITPKIQARISVTNVFDKEYFLINNLGLSPFDYRQARRWINAGIKIAL